MTCMAKRVKFEAVDVSDVEFPSQEFEPFARFVMQALRNHGYDYRQAGAPRKQRSFIKEFALRHGLLYQTLWVAATGQAVPKNDFIVALGKALGLTKDGVFVLLLLAHQARTPDPYRKMYTALIEEVSAETGVAELLG